MPDWKSDIGRRPDSVIERTVPGVSKAVKWNSPFYGVECEGWFLSFHCFTKYVKVTIAPVYNFSCIHAPASDRTPFF